MVAFRERTTSFRQTDLYRGESIKTFTFPAALIKLKFHAALDTDNGKMILAVKLKTAGKVLNSDDF